MIFALKFSRSPYFDNHLSASIHTCKLHHRYLVGLAFILQHWTPGSMPGGGGGGGGGGVARGQNLVHILK